MKELNFLPPRTLRQNIKSRCSERNYEAVTDRNELVSYMRNLLQNDIHPTGKLLKKLRRFAKKPTSTNREFGYEHEGNINKCLETEVEKFKFDFEVNSVYFAESINNKL